MEPSKEELIQLYSKFSDQKLLDILYNKEEYRPEALEAATEELGKRNVSTETTTNFLQEKEASKTKAEENANIPLPFHQKILFFFGWFIPMFFGGAYKLNYAEDGMLKKLRQCTWYSVAGFIALLLTTIIAITGDLGNTPSFAILIGCFFVFYLVEGRINT